MVPGETKKHMSKGFPRWVKGTIFCRPGECSPEARRERESTRRAGVGVGGGTPDRRSFTKSSECSEGQAQCQALSILRHRICSGLRWAHGQLMVPTALECFGKPPEALLHPEPPSQPEASQGDWMGESLSSQAGPSDPQAGP